MVPQLRCDSEENLHGDGDARWVGGYSNCCTSGPQTCSILGQKSFIHCMLHTWKSFFELHLNYRHDVYLCSVCILKFDIRFYHLLITWVAFMPVMKWSLIAIPVLFRNIFWFWVFQARKLNIENFRHKLLHYNQNVVSKRNL